MRNRVVELIQMVQCSMWNVSEGMIVKSSKQCHWANENEYDGL
jgi:hypothetical protein